MAISSTQKTEILKIVAGLFNAAPGAAYLTELSNLVSGGMTTSQLADALGNHDLFTKGIMAGKVTEVEQAAVIAHNFGLAADSDPLSAGSQAVAYITNLIHDKVGFGNIVFQAINYLAGPPAPAPEFATTAILLENKAKVADAYSLNNSSTDVSTLQNVLSNVTGTALYTPDEVAAVLAGSGATGGKTFTLSADVQNLVGSSGNDTFIAGIEGGDATLDAGDVIDGGAGVDILKIFNNSSINQSANFSTALISNLETVQLTAADGGTNTLNVSSNAAVTRAGLVNGVGADLSLKVAQAATLAGDIDASSDVAKFLFTNATGSSDSATLELDSANTLIGDGSNNGLGMQIDDIETLNIVAKGTNILGDLTANNIKKVVVTGDGSVSFHGVNGTFATIDASANKGGVAADVNDLAAATLKLTGGTGNDTFVVDYDNISTADKIDFGAGTADFLSLYSNGVGDVDLTDQANVDLLDNVKNYEGIQINGTASLELDASLLKISQFNVSSTGTSDFTEVVSGSKITYGGFAVGASTVAMALGEKALTVNLSGDKVNESDLTSGLTVTGATDIALNSTGFSDAGDPNVFNLSTDSNTTITVTGDIDTNITTALNSGTTGLTIKASAFTGKLEITGTAQKDVIVGGTNDDILTGGAAADTLTGNGGEDKFVIEGAVSATPLPAEADIVTDFLSGTDTLDFGTGTAAIVSTYSEATAAVANFTAALAAANNAVDTTVIYSAQQVGSDTWVFFDNDADGTIGNVGTDAIVKLTGVSLDKIAFGDIVG